MPVYEYYCSDCHGVFELLRAVREASMPQPCPDCDADARRIMPTEFSAFVLRDGYPRRLPDRGKYWHNGEEVSTLIDRPMPPGQHPELYRSETAGPLNAEERDLLEVHIAADRELRLKARESRSRDGADVVHNNKSQIETLKKRLRITRSSRAVGSRTSAPPAKRRTRASGMEG